MNRDQANCNLYLDLKDPLAALKGIAPEACKSGDLMNGIVALIKKHVKPQGNALADNRKTAQILHDYVKSLGRRMPPKRPRTSSGTLKSLEAFVTRDIKSYISEFSVFEADAEQSLINNPAMHLTARGVELYQTRALGVIDRLMATLSTHWGRLGEFKAKLLRMEQQFYDRDGWALHLHDRINRLANLFTSIDAAATSLKRAIINDASFEKSLDALRAIHDTSLDPLEFVAKVCSGHDHPYTIEVSAQKNRFRYSDHFLLREILLELVHNAAANNARRIKLSTKIHSPSPSPRLPHQGGGETDTPKNSVVYIEVEDDCPGGISEEILSHIGKERIAAADIPGEKNLFKENPTRCGWGLYTLINTLVPRIGGSLEFTTPLTPKGGTRCTITVPIVRNETEFPPTPRTRFSKSIGIFTSLDSFACGGVALRTSRLNMRMKLPISSKPIIN